MRITPEIEPAERPDRPAAVVWHQPHSKQISAVAVWSEKRAGLGEDAEPTFLHHTGTERGLLGVYDGLGGAGARHVGAAADGRHLSHAFVASRLGHLTVQSWFADRVQRNEPVGNGGVVLRDRLASALAGARSPGRAKLGGTLRRDFPTTVALLEYRKVRTSVDITAYWAGDSRCYLLTTDQGLQQLSRDDSDIHDPLELLIADQPMTNLAHASGDFTINERHLGRLRLPCVLVCATDGFFGYVASPALFEWELLNELVRAHDERDWGIRLARRVVSYTSDDASLVVVSLGFKTFADVRIAFAHRQQELHDLHYQPLRKVDSRDELVLARQQSWERYRRQYMHHVEPQWQ